MRTRTLMAVVAGGSLLLTGCSANVTGNGAAGVTVVKGGVGKAIATPAPGGASATTTPSTTTAAPSTTGSAPSSGSAAVTAIPLAENGNGYTFIQTRSGRTRCQISESSAGCQLVFDKPRPRTESGDEANGVNITKDGALSYVLGNLGDIDPETLDYTTYTARGWFIVANQYGTAFTHRTTGHGMVVSSAGVQVF